MRNKIIGTALFLATSVVLADDWIRIAGTDDDQWIYYVLKGSYEVRVNKSNEEIAVITGKTDDKKKGSIELERLYVTTANCKRKQGKAVAVTMDGAFKYEYDFIFKAGSVGSAKAEFVCNVHSINTSEKEKKGL
jgi:hypothetical protein